MNAHEFDQDGRYSTLPAQVQDEREYEDDEDIQDRTADSVEHLAEEAA
jgi:hypothetical protein